MPSSVGHALAGVAVAWTGDLLPGSGGRRAEVPHLALVCALLAALPDIDLAFHTHRTATHSVGAVILTAIIAAVVTRQVTRGPVLRIALLCGAALGTHVLLDWLAIDRYPPSGIQALWPFSSGWYTSGLEWFPQVQRNRFFSPATLRFNAHTIVEECIRLAPLLAALAWLRARRAKG